MIKKGFPVLWAAFLLISCGNNDLSLKDGYYTAMNAEFDPFGWKEYVTVCASGGRIILIEYNAFNVSGFIKSWDMHYMREMSAVNKIYPNAYSRYYIGQVLKNQGIEEVNALSGATNSYHAFIKLAEAAIENARLGISDTQLISLEEYYRNEGNLEH